MPSVRIDRARLTIHILKYSPPLPENSNSCFGLFVSETARSITPPLLLILGSCELFCRSTGCGRGSVSQAIAKAEQRIIGAAADVDGFLFHVARPAETQLAGGGIVTEQHVGEALAFGARQPGRDDGISLLEYRTENQRATRIDDHHDGNATCLHALHQCEVISTQREVSLVTDTFSVRLLTDNDDAKIGAFDTGAISRMG